jgi:hypothetical protein
MPRHYARSLPALTLALASAALGCEGKTTPKIPDTSGPVSSASSDAKGRQELGLTVYNQNFALVREVRTLKLGTGRVELDYGDVAAQVQPETVAIRALDDPSALTVLEQNYRYDLLQPRTLLDKYVGQTIKVYRYNEELGREDAFDAKVLAANDGGTVLEIGGEVTYDFPGRFAFPKVPDNLIAKPTLVWLLGSSAPEQRVEVSYLTRGVTWSSDYVLTIDEADTRADLTGWVTLVNESGTSYENARLKLVAGDVQRVTPTPPVMREMLERVASEEEDQSGFREEGFFEYHLYTLERPTSVLEKETKQVTLLEGRGAAVQKKLVLPAQEHWYRGRYGTVVSNQKVGVFLHIENAESNGLGMALPKGIVRVYKADSTGAKQFIGEDQIDHTPRDETIRIKMGEAFDVVADRKQMSWTPLGSCTAESSWEIEIRNHKDGAETVEVVEPVGGDWEIVSESQSHTKKDAHTFVFEVPVPARGKATVSYRVRIRWC